MFINKRKNGYYFVQYFDEDENKVRRISARTKIKSEAVKFLSGLNTKLKSIPKEKNISLKEFSDEYIAAIGNTLSRSYLKSIKLSFRQLQKHTGDTELKSIKVRNIQQFISNTFQRTERGTGLYYRTLKAAFTRAVDWEYISENPFKKVKLPKIQKSFPAFITEVELNKILDSTKNNVLQNIFTIAFYSGLRLSELTNLKWASIDFTENIITLYNGNGFNTKNKKDRIIPMNKKVREIFLNILPKDINKNESRYVFEKHKDVRYNNEYISKKFKQGVRLAELDDRIHYHTLRHSFASNLVQKGVSLYVVKELLGHENITTTQIYSHVQNPDLVDAIKLL
ncbi:MAG: tyrosine-type recombinase/integrase [Bacteroidetes bacterium]|nr:tyrosine-type recombinase/integrase [Bacteroidota bacterium]